MRILFSGTPAFGHLLPMVPLAYAARRTGHEVAFLTSGGFADTLRPFPVLASGPEIGDIMAEAMHRSGIRVGDAPTPANTAEIFAGTRVDLTFDEAITQARAYEPDLIVAEAGDFVGPMVAATVGAPWASYAISLAGIMSGPIGEAMRERSDQQHAQRGLRPTPRLAYVDAFPEALQLPNAVPPADTVTIQAQPHTQEGATWTAPTFPGREDRPLVLLTLGTVVGDPTLMGSMPDTLSGSMQGTLGEVNVVVTANTQEKADALEVDRSRIFPVGFVPLEHLLDGVDVVISAGGAGTVLAALSRGLPMVLLPLIADQPVNAGQVAAAGAGVVVEGPDEVGAAVRRVLDEPSYRTSARRVADQISRMDAPERVLTILSERAAQGR